MGEVLAMRPDYAGRVWQFNEDEDAALQYLPHSDQVIYLRGLRKNMDFTTGIVGIRRRISYQFLAELLEVQRARGSTVAGEHYNKEQLRACLRRLEGAGLVARVQSGAAVAAPLVFRLPLAHTDLNRFYEEPHRNPTEGTPQQNPVGATVCQSSAPQQEQGMNPIPQIIRNNSPKGECAKPAVSALGVGHCPHAEILAMWADVFPGRQQPKPTLWPASESARHLAARWAQCAKIKHSSGIRTLYHDRASGLEWWRKFFEYVANKNSFLTRDDSGWFTLHWLVRKRNFLKVLDKAYEDK